MANSFFENEGLTSDGLSTQNGSELLTSIQTILTTIYAPNGEEIDFGSNSPDGQFTNLLTTMGQTYRELATQVYNATDPDKCDGTQQDTKYALNYLKRKGGSYTTQSIEITANQTVELQGLDGSYNNSTSGVYTIADDNGNNWFLIDTTTVYSGTTSLEFRAENMGTVIPTIGTITKQVTIIEGITNVINNVSYTELGTNSESNQDFKIRRAKSLYLASGNNTDKIYSEVLNLTGVNDCNIHDNRNSVTDATGTDAHTIWLVVDGGANTDIANIIYNNIGGAGTRGNLSIPIESMAGQVNNIHFDRPNIIPYYIKFELYPVSNRTDLNVAQIKNGTVDNLNFLLGEDVNISTINTAINIGMGLQGGIAYPQNIQISLGGNATAQATGNLTVSVNSNIFQSVIFVNKETDETGTYVFTYNNGNWTYENNIVNITDYGIIVEGTPTNGDTITVSYTAGEWVSVIKAESIQTKYLTDYNRIYVKVINE